MVTQIEWSDKSKSQAKNIISFLRENFTENAVENFKLNLERKLIFVAENPYTGRKVNDKKTIRFSNFGKYYRIYYRISGSKLFVSNIFDTRQDPSKRPY
jgi:plasmid stabilization system protein ParE